MYGTLVRIHESKDNAGWRKLATDRKCSVGWLLVVSREKLGMLSDLQVTGM